MFHLKYLRELPNRANTRQIKEQLAMFEVQQVIKPEPFLKWAGGKGQLLGQFTRFFPTSFRRYFEPFVGSGAVFFHLYPNIATLNDSNPNLIAAYIHIQENVEDLMALLRSFRNNYHSLTSDEQEREYYRIRDSYNLLPVGSLEKSALLIVLNKTGYNGLYRENSKGGFNVPFGRYDNPAMFSESNLRAVSAALQNVKLVNMDFAEAVEDTKVGDFVYFDPPYMPVSKTANFTSYTKDDFGLDKQALLAKVAQDLTNRGVLVMLSNSDNDFIRNLYPAPDFFQHTVKANRAINSNPDARGKVTELVITNYRSKL